MASSIHRLLHIKDPASSRESREELLWSLVDEIPTEMGKGDNWRTHVHEFTFGSSGWKWQLGKWG